MPRGARLHDCASEAPLWRRARPLRDLRASVVNSFGARGTTLEECARPRSGGDQGFSGIQISKPPVPVRPSNASV